MSEIMRDGFGGTETMPTENPLLIAHLDLKGVRYRQDFMSTYLQRLKRLGYNALLVEYENCFPFQGMDFPERSDAEWSPEFFRMFLAEARGLGLEIIPLQQSLAHLEYLFRDESCSALALSDGVPSDLDIFNPAARAWMRQLLMQVLEAHPSSRFIHLGMDEARRLARFTREAGLDFTALFLEYLDELCQLCDAHGKIPMIWGDMLADHLTSENLPEICAFAGRVVVVHWDYLGTEEVQEHVRLGGTRCSRQLTEPGNQSLARPPHWEFNSGYFEDWPESVLERIAPYRVGPRHMQALFPAAFWKDLGFQVIGGAAAAITADGSLLPFYHQRMGNVALWLDRVERYGLEGVIVTQWSRENSLAIPNVLPDTAWPVLTYAACLYRTRFITKETAHEHLFFRGLCGEDTDRLFHQIGLCRDGWQQAPALVHKMMALADSLLDGAWEWQLIGKLVEWFSLVQKVEKGKDQFRRYGGLGRLPARGWEERVLALVAEATAALPPLEAGLSRLVRERYEGQAVDEWLTVVISRFRRELEEFGDRVRAEMEQVGK